MPSRQPAASRPPSKARGTSFSPPRLPDRLFRSRVGVECELLLREGVCQPPYYPYPCELVLREGVCQPPYYPRPCWAGRVGQPCVSDRPTREAGDSLHPIPMHAGAPPSPTIYTHGIIVYDACCNARARGLCESWRCGGVSCQSKQSLHLRRHRGDPGHTRDRQTRQKLMKLT